MTYLPQKAVLYGLAAGLVLLSAQLSTMSGRASDYRVGSIVITQPWARATPKGASTGAAYMTITNTGSAPDRVSCVSSDASAECQIHIMTMDSGVMKMRRVEGGLQIKPNEIRCIQAVRPASHVGPPQASTGRGQDGESHAQIRQRRDGGGWIPHRGNWRSCARWFCRGQRRHDARARRRDANGQALTIRLTSQPSHPAVDRLERCSPVP